MEYLYLSDYTNNFSTANLLFTMAGPKLTVNCSYFLIAVKETFKGLWTILKWY